MHWTSLTTRDAPLRTCWQADEIVATRGEVWVDRLRADDIQRVTLVHAETGDSPGEVLAALFALPDRVVLLGAMSGVAGRVLFERQAYWAQRSCIYWVSERFVTWPPSLCESRWPFGRQVPLHRSLTTALAADLLAHAAISGPHTWDQRKRLRIERRRPFPGRALDMGQARSSATT